MKKEEYKHPTVKSENGAELFFNEKGQLVGEEIRQGYICPQTKVQCDDECCVSAEDCHIESSKNSLSEETLSQSFCDNCNNDVCCCIERGDFPGVGIKVFCIELDENYNPQKDILPAPTLQDIFNNMFGLMDRYAEDVMGGCTLRAKEWFEQQSKIK